MSFFRRAPVIVAFVLFASPAAAQAPDVQGVTANALLDSVRAHDARLIVVNFWATWCAPCIEEFPYFVRLGKNLAAEGVDVFFVSMDFEEDRAAVEAFLAERHWTGPAFLRVGKDDPFIATMHDDWSGVVPATILFDADARPVDFWQGAPVDYETLRVRVVQALES